MVQVPSLQPAARRHSVPGSRRAMKAACLPYPAASPPVSVHHASPSRMTPATLKWTAPVRSESTVPASSQSLAAQALATVQHPVQRIHLYLRRPQNRLPCPRREPEMASLGVHLARPTPVAMTRTRS
ncbi:hypothetical protein L917_08902 [Phytophthora nicotianae]|uniref:Uncharacterized protein n=1 Tax=Phytophthora nicotianae TaxID=4792 RepID=W2L647_PHYNI|nr:hypothetical protein L917_08902 [Phytophthora nicotianae]